MVYGSISMLMTRGLLRRVGLLFVGTGFSFSLGLVTSLQPESKQSQNLVRQVEGSVSGGLSQTYGCTRIGYWNTRRADLPSFARPLPGRVWNEDYWVCGQRGGGRFGNRSFWRMCGVNVDACGFYLAPESGLQCVYSCVHS